MSDDIHVYPVNDSKPHILSGTDCPCKPRVEIEGATLVIIHNSWDNREIIEEAINIMNEEANHVG
jgi:hypothetical protein